MSPFSFGFIRFFLFLPEQTAKGISKRERFFDAFVSIFKVFFETVIQSLYPGTFKELTNGIKIIHVIFLG